MLSIKQRFFNPMQNYFAVTMLVNASKPRFKGSYSDVPALPTGCTLLASVGDSDCLLTVQKYNIGLTREVSRVKKMQKNALFMEMGRFVVFK